MRGDKQIYDVIIIGAGPAGCVTARYLPNNFKVLIVDTALFPGEKVCGGLLSREAWCFLKRFKVPERLLDLPGKLIFRYVDAARMVERDIGLLLYNTSRQRLNEWLQSILSDRVEIWQDTSFLNYRDYGKYVEVELKRGSEHMTVLSRYLVGSDGARSLVRQQVSTGDIRHLVVLQDWIRPEKPLPPHFDCVLSNKMGPGFVYSYIIPKGRLAIVGSVFHPDARSISALHERMKDTLNDKIGRFSKLVRRESGIIFRPRLMEDVLLGKGRVLLVGEAAGFMNPISGEGIGYALYSGEACGMAFRSGQDPLEQYSQLATPLLGDIRSKFAKFRFVEGMFSHAVITHMPVRVLSWLSKKL